MKTKRLLSVILVVVIALAILPTAFASDAGTGTIEYVFNSKAFDSSSELSITKAYAKTQSDVASAYNKWNIEGLSWVLDTSKLNPEYLYLHAAKGRVDASSTAVIATAIVLRIDKTGSFSTSITYIPETSAPIYNVYLVKKDSDDNILGFTSNKNNANLTSYINDLDEAKLLGTVNMYSTDSTQKTEPLKTVNITETGDYYLILAENGADASFEANIELNANGRVTTKLCSFGLTPVKAAIEYEFNCNAFGETMNITDAAIVTKKQSDIADGYNKWNIEGVSQVRTGSAIQNGALYILGSTNRVINSETQTNEGTTTIAAAIVLDVTQTGTFIPKLAYTGRPNSPKYKVFFVKKKTGDDVSGWCDGSKHNSNNPKLNDYIATLADAEYLGEVETYSQEVMPNSSTELNTLNIAETGEYYLILADNGINSAVETVDNVQTYINSFSLIPADKNEEVVNAFAIDNSRPATYSASLATTCVALDKNSITATASATDTDGDGVYYVTADEFDSTGEYSFLYWVKGLTSDKANKIVSMSPTIEEYKPQNGGNYLIAVYENKNAETEAKAEFYDGNGQLLYTTAEDGVEENDVTVEDGVITMPSLPQMANYERATHWQLYGDSSNTKYGADVATAELSGNMIFVAQYDDVYITVNGDDVRYGDSVPFTAKDDTEKEYFKWWTRTANGVGEIVSLKREYIFCPWEDCTVTAVYGDEKQIIAGNLRKIVLNKLGNNAIMAEFIGLDGAEVVEKGIVLGEKKIAMSTNASQFTITNNIGATSASGYAIIKDGNSYVEITDGTIALNQ